MSSDRSVQIAREFLREPHGGYLLHWIPEHVEAVIVDLATFLDRELAELREARDRAFEAANRDLERRRTAEAEVGRLRGALEQEANNCPVCEGTQHEIVCCDPYDEIPCRGCSHILAALSPAPPEPGRDVLTPEQMKARLLELARPIHAFIQEHNLAGFCLDDGPSEHDPKARETFTIDFDVYPLPPRIKFVLKRYGSIIVEDPKPDPRQEAMERVCAAALESLRQGAGWWHRLKGSTWAPDIALVRAVSDLTALEGNKGHTPRESGSPAAPRAGGRPAAVNLPGSLGEPGATWATSAPGSAETGE